MLKFGLVYPVYECTLNVPFSNSYELVLVQEGSTVRYITRIDEICRDVRNCARAVENPMLHQKMEEKLQQLIGTLYLPRVFTLVSLLVMLVRIFLSNTNSIDL